MQVPTTEGLRVVRARPRYAFAVDEAGRVYRAEFTLDGPEVYHPDGPGALELGADWLRALRRWWPEARTCEARRMAALRTLAEQGRAWTAMDCDGCGARGACWVGP